MDIQSISVKTITTSPTTLTALNTFSVLNGSAQPLNISTDGGVNQVVLTTGQTLMLSANAGFILPDIRLSGTSMSAEVITT